MYKRTGDVFILDILHIIVPPIIGGLIGLLTNGIAIKMMFRPLKPVYIGKFRLPFTPGIIPKERERIAKAVGRVVGSDILDNDTIKKAMLSDNVHNKLNDKIEEFIEEYKSAEYSISEYLEEGGYLEKIDGIETKLSADISEFVRKKLVEADIGTVIVESAFTEISSKLNPMVMAIAGNAINSAKAPLAQKVNDLANEKAGDMVNEYINTEYKNILQRSVGETITVIDEKFPELKKKIWDIYSSFINKKLGGMLSAFNVAEVIEQKINELDIARVEELIMSIIKKELNAIIYLGGLLGLLMGIANIFF
jgi:uncharacterized membrane protein YheB (UPF0754 family)